MASPWDRFREWASGSTDPGDPTWSDAQAEAYTDAKLAAIAASFVTDEADLPAETEPRVNGTELDGIEQLFGYLNEGFLLADDGAGGYLPIPYLHIVKNSDPDGNVTYDAWFSVSE